MKSLLLSAAALTLVLTACGKQAAPPPAPAPASQAAPAPAAPANEMTKEDKEKAMEEAVAIDTKCDEAASYVMAMEFQLWKQGIDTPADRERLNSDAIIEIFRVAKNYMTGTTDVSPASTDGRMENLYALSAALHKINPNQQAQADELGIKPISMYDLITQALTIGLEIKHNRRDPGTVPQWVTEVLRAQPTAIYLLQVRHNFLGAMPLADISQIKAEGWLGLNSLLHQAEMFLSPWTPNFNEMNQAMLAYDVLKMQYASATGQFLISINENPKLDPSLVKIWKHMRQDRTANTKEDTAAGPRTDLIVQLKGAAGNFSDGN